MECGSATASRILLAAMIASFDLFNSCSSTMNSSPPGAHRVRGAHTIEQPFCNALQKLVAVKCPGIVDVFEAIKVKEQHRDPAVSTRSHSDGLIEPVVQEQAVGQIVRGSCSAEWAICSAIARAALTSRKTRTEPVTLSWRREWEPRNLR